MPSTTTLRHVVLNYRQLRRDMAHDGKTPFLRRDKSGALVLDVMKTRKLRKIAAGEGKTRRTQR